MNKKNLTAGKHFIKTRAGDIMFLGIDTDDEYILINEQGETIYFDEYDDNLLHVYDKDYDIMEAGSYNVLEHLSIFNNIDWTWERETEPTEDELATLRLLSKSFNSIGRNLNGSVYVVYKRDYINFVDVLDNDFKFIKRGEEYNLKELLNND